MSEPIVRAPLSEEAKFLLSELKRFEELFEESLSSIRGEIAKIQASCAHDLQPIIEEIRPGYKRCVRCGLLDSPIS